MRTYEYIVVHTGGAYNAKRNRVAHHSFEMVRRDHMLPLARYDAAGKLVPGTGGRGFKDIAYNRYVEVDGKIRLGRPDAVAGEHTAGFNYRSLGVCCSGSGDHEPFNPAQLRSLVAQCAAWCRLYDLDADRVIGHREAPRFGAKPTPKSCPGKLVDMDMIRALVRDELAGTSRGAVAPANDNTPPTRRDGSPKAEA
jgi:hypothetical protein